MRRSLGFMLFCHHFCARLGEFLDGELSDSERERLAAHLEGCAECSHAKRELEADRDLARAALGELEGMSAPPDLRLRVRAALQNEPQKRARPIFVPIWQRWNPSKWVWAGTLAFSALALMILARPFATAPVSDAPMLDSAPLPERKIQVPPAATRSNAQGRTSAQHLPIAPRKASKIIVVRPTAVPNPTASPRTKAPRTETPRTETPHRVANSAFAGRPAPQVKTPPATKPSAPKVAAAKPAPRKIFQSPTFPAFSTRKTSPAAPLSPARQNSSATPALPSEVAPPDAESRLRADSNPAPLSAARVSPPRRTQTPQILHRSVPAAPRFALALSALVNSAGKNGTTVLGRNRTSIGQGLLYDDDVAPANAPLAKPAAPASETAATASKARDERLKRAGAPSLAEALEARRAAPAADAAAPNALAPDAATAGESASPRLTIPPSILQRSGAANFQVLAPARSFRLSVAASRSISNAQIRVVLPPPLRFSGAEASASRVLWRGDFAANAPVVLVFSLQGARGGEKISVVLEQNEGEGKSKSFETQVLTLPPQN